MISVQGSSKLHCEDPHLPRTSSHHCTSTPSFSPAIRWRPRISGRLAPNRGVLAPDDRRFSVFIGGSMLADLDTFTVPRWCSRRPREFEWPSNGPYWVPMGFAAVIETIWNDLKCSFQRNWTIAALVVKDAILEHIV